MTERRLAERRRVQRGGRRGTDGPPPTLREEIEMCARDIDAALTDIRVAFDSGDLAAARVAAKALQRAAAGIRVLLGPTRSP
jgi:hypothetical protein